MTSPEDREVDFIPVRSVRRPEVSFNLNLIWQRRITSLLPCASFFEASGRIPEDSPFVVRDGSGSPCCRAQDMWEEASLREDLANKEKTRVITCASLPPRRITVVA